MILTFTCITIIYVLLIAGFIYGFEKVIPFKLTNLPSKTRFSVIIPFRNEAENLPSLLESIKALQYPRHLFEIIFVDDDSKDNSAEIIKKVLDTKFLKKNFTRTDISIIKNIRTTNSPKKEAITTAINLAKYEWIITTDADCIVPKYWLDSFDEFIQQTLACCIAAPVTYHTNSRFLNRFQTLDMLSLQGATMGSFGINKPFLCNGANFGYKKEVFMQVNGFEGNTNIASGDDIFLLEKLVKHHPKAVRFLKCEQAIVTTSSQPTWNELLAQRIRWAAKTTSYNQWFGKFTGLMVLLMNALFIVCVLLTITGILKVKILFYTAFIKFNIDVLLLYKTATFFNQNDILKSVPFAFIVYPFFCVYVAFLSLFKGFKWKGRSYVS